MRLKSAATQLTREIYNISIIPKKPIFFMLLTRERSGSTCLLDLLNSQKHISTDPHAFFDYTNPPRIFNQKSLYSNRNVRGFKFKIQPSQSPINDENLRLATQGLKKLMGQGIMCIHLERTNILRQVTSWIIADERKKENYQNYKKGQKPIKLSSIEIDPEKLMFKMREFKAKQDFAREAVKGFPHLYLSYEKDLRDEKIHQQTLDKICDYLGIDTAKVITRFSRVSPPEMSTYITNYAEVIQYLSKTEFSIFLDEWTAPDE